ncbi:MAG: glycosyltransferase family 4 protein [Pseudomonadota bacterium]
MKPRILVIIDVPGWSLDRTAVNVMERLRNLYCFEKAYNSNAAAALGRKNYDLVYITYERQFQDAGITAPVPRPALIGVRCHVKWDGGAGLPPAPEFLQHLNSFDALHVPSLILHNIFKDRHPAVFHTPHGVDETVFHPKKGEPFASPRGTLVLGWAGSRSNHPGKRGIEDFIIPAVTGLGGVTLKFAAREDRWRTQEEMAEFYSSLDAYICASRTEGGPHPLLEASACGIPVISTMVGIAPELITHGDNGMLIERTVDALQQAVVFLRDNKEQRLHMGRRSREVIEKGWTWDKQALKYVPFFNYGLEKGRVH